MCLNPEGLGFQLTIHRSDSLAFLLKSLWLNPPGIPARKLNTTTLPLPAAFSSADAPTTTDRDIYARTPR